MARVLEISRVPLFKRCLPRETTWFSLGASLIAGDEGCESERFTARRAWRLVRELRAGAYDLVILPAVDIGYAYDPGRLKRWLRRLVRVAASTRLAATVLEAVFRWSRNVVVFEDVSDLPTLSYEVCALVPGFLAYFKREADPARTPRPGARWEAVNARVVPWSLFLPTTDVVPDASQKTSDVFFAGHCHNAVRQRGLPQLRRLEARGCRVDVPAERLDYREYMARMAAAWLVWSPEGYGWDCYRHYEAAFAGAVPVINRPAPGRVPPYEDGAQCFYYPPEDDRALEETVLHALADKERLRTMAAAARERVLARFTRPALVAGMQAEIARRLRAAGRPSSLVREWEANALEAVGPLSA